MRAAMRRMAVGLLCCARNVRGHAVADPTIALMKSRRRIAFPGGLGPRLLCNYSRVLRRAIWGPITILRGNNGQDRMSALGQKQTLAHVRVMASPPKADIHRRERHVRFVPKADISQCPIVAYHASE